MRWLAGVVLLLATTRLLEYAILVYRSTLEVGSQAAQGWSYALSAPALVSSLLLLVTLAWLGLRASGRPGRRLFALAFACTVLAALLPSAGIAFFELSVRWFSRALPAILGVVNYAAFALLFAAALLLAIGLMRSSLAPARVAWMGIVVAALMLAVFVGHRVLPGLPTWLSSIATLADAAFLFALGWSLMATLPEEGESSARPAVVFAVLSASLLMVVGLTAGAAVLGVRRDVAAMPPASQAPVVLTSLYPGFSHEGDLPQIDSSEKGDILEQFTVLRYGNTVMQVEISPSSSLVSTEGPIHGKALAVPLQGGGQWYVGDNYFVVHKDSAFGGIPRPTKLALWDAFSASQKERVRVLGVFPSDSLHDRSVLAVDGYSPGDLAGATIVVYTTEFESAINEELPWATVDELIENGRKYEGGSQMGSSDKLHELRVTAFVPIGETWKAAPRSSVSGAVGAPH